MFEVERFNIKDQFDLEKYYPIVKDWWEGKGWKAVHPNYLSTNGLIIKKDKNYICAGWIYCTDSNLGMISAIITNNEKKIGFLKKQALKCLITNLEELAKNLGIKLVYTPMETKSIGKLLEAANHNRTSKEISEFFKSI